MMMIIPRLWCFASDLSVILLLIKNICVDFGGDYVVWYAPWAYPMYTGVSYTNVNIHWWLCYFLMQCRSLKFFYCIFIDKLETLWKTRGEYSGVSVTIWCKIFMFLAFKDKRQDNIARFRAISRIRLLKNLRWD